MGFSSEQWRKESERWWWYLAVLPMVISLTLLSFYLPELRFFALIVWPMAAVFAFIAGFFYNERLKQTGSSSKIPRFRRPGERGSRAP